MKILNKAILLVCLSLGITACSTQQVLTAPTQKIIVLEPSPVNTLQPNLTATKYPNSKLCVTENHQGHFLTSFRKEFGESPDKTWLFVQCLYDDEKHSHYVLHNQFASEKTWALESPEITENPWTWYAWGWAKDSQTLYIGYHGFCEYWSTCMYIDAKGIFSVNPNSQEFSSVLPFREDERQYALSFNHDMNLLAYTITGEQILYIKNLLDNTEVNIEMDTSQISYGDLYWSPNDKVLVFRSSAKDNLLDLSLWKLNLGESSVTQVLANDDRDFFIDGWVDNDKILLNQFGAEANQPFRYTYDIFTGEIQLFEEPIASATP